MAPLSSSSGNQQMSSSSSSSQGQLLVVVHVVSPKSSSPTEQQETSHHLHQQQQQEEEENDKEEEDRWSDTNFTEMAHLWKLNDEEQSQLRQLETLLSDISHWKNDPFEVVRYFREYRTVPKAATMFRRMVEWRVANRIDEFLDDYGDPPHLFHHLPTFVCQGLDRDGDPIYVERTGASDPYGLVLAYGGLEPLADYTQFIREMTTTRRRRRRPSTRNHGRSYYCWQRDYYEPLVKRRMTQFTVIMDMEGLHPRHMRGGLLGLLKRMARISQDYYAGFGKRVIMLRAPAIFEWGWRNVVQHFFDPHIRDLIVFSTPEDYLDVLDRYIDLTVLPPCLAPGHGRGKAMPGYFENVHLEGGMIPKQENTGNQNHQDDNDSTVAASTATASTTDRFAVAGSDRSNGIREECQDGELVVEGESNDNAKIVVMGGSLLKGQWDLLEHPQHPAREFGTQVTVFPVRTVVTR